MSIENKTCQIDCQFELKQDSLDEMKGIFEGYASTFGNVDGQMDIVARGAFEDSLKTREPKVLWQHDMASPIGKLLDAREDERGLFVRAKLATNTTKGADAFELLKEGVIDTMSVGFRVKEADFDREEGIRIIKEAELFEFSLVTIPANDQARVMSVKSKPPKDMRGFEKFLRASGFSRKDATAITQRGYTGYLNQSESDSDSPSLNQSESDEVKTLLTTLLKKMETNDVGNDRNKKSYR